LSIKIQEHFQFGPSWYRQAGVRDLVLQYYFVLRSVLRIKPCLRRCLTRCRHCRIFFLTHPCNAGRNDLGCPFGCRDVHRKRRSTERSVEYYRTEEGKLKKKIQNGKRGKPETEADLGGGARVIDGNLVPDERRFDSRMVSYLRMVTSLIEGRPVSVGEIVAMLQRAMRQHSIVRRRRIDYVVRYLNEHAP
jgi:hypothetical protein